MRWTDQRKQVRQAVVDKLDGLLTERQSLDDGRRDIRQSRNAEFRELELKDREGEGRWIERLHRIEEWKNRAAELQSEQVRLEKGVSGTLWFERAQSVASRFSRRLEKQIAHLNDFEKTLRSDLEAWPATLAAKRADLEAFQVRQKAHATPLLVSRGRKKPESDFVQEQTQAEVSATTALQGLRQAINVHLNRLYLTSKTIEARAAESPARLELRRNALQEQLKDVQLSFFALRERVLADVLSMETCRRELRWIRDAVDGMKCIEDVYKAPEPFWRRVTRALGR